MDKNIVVSTVEVNVKDNSISFKVKEVFNNIKDLNTFLENNTGVFSVNLESIQDITIKENSNKYKMEELNMKNTWTNGNLDLMVTLFELQSEKEIKNTIDKLNTVELIWSSEVTMKDLINTWVNITNEKAVTMHDLLDGFYKSSNSAKSNGTTYESLSNIISDAVTVTRENANSIGNALESVIARLDTDKIKNQLSQYGIEVKDTDSFSEVLDKVKSKIKEVSGMEEKNNLLLKLSEVLGESYNLSKVSAILQ